MKRENIHQNVEVLYKKMKECAYPVQLTFFQITCVISGTGNLKINGNTVTYHPGHIMLMTPNDQYNFEIKKETEFLLVKFDRNYVREFNWKTVNCIECVLYHATHLSSCVLKNSSDIPLAHSIVQALLHETRNKDKYSDDLITHFVNALITIISRNLTKLGPTAIQDSADNRIQQIIDYIQVNIYTPSAIKASEIAKRFDISETYLGSYFKKQAGETLQNFIKNFKIRLIEHRLKFSDIRINELVSEFGFSDESHLNKFFKSKKGVSLTTYRKLQAHSKAF
ncbi:MAG: helix-turn-helix transcriptional regulator [Filimonas sp.]|nr:helix-turn-helix transcriptional regulator [Filimonas sp.]